MGALKCTTGNVCQYLCPSCGNCSNEVSATGERNIRGMLLSAGGGLGAASRSKELWGLGVLDLESVQSWEAHCEWLGQERSNHSLEVLLLEVVSLLRRREEKFSLLQGFPMK